MHSEDKVIAASIAIRNIIDSSDRYYFEVCGSCIIEFCSAFSMSDEEIWQALQIASGNSREGDDFLDEMISRIKA